MAPFRTVDKMPGPDTHDSVTVPAPSEAGIVQGLHTWVISRPSDIPNHDDLRAPRSTSADPKLLRRP